MKSFVSVGVLLKLSVSFKMIWLLCGIFGLASALASIPMLRKPMKKIASTDNKLTYVPYAISLQKDPTEI